MDCPVKLRSGIPTDADMRKINAVSSVDCRSGVYIRYEGV